MVQLVFIAQQYARVRRARVVAKDVCDVAFDTHAGGSIVCVRDKAETQLAERAVRGVSLMYVSVGIDARLVYTAELHRRRSRARSQVLGDARGVPHCEQRQEGARAHRPA
jgi:hypothetical protein